VIEKRTKLFPRKSEEKTEANVRRADGDIWRKANNGRSQQWAVLDSGGGQRRRVSQHHERKHQWRCISMADGDATSAKTCYRLNRRAVAALGIGFSGRRLAYQTAKNGRPSGIGALHKKAAAWRRGGETKKATAGGDHQLTLSANMVFSSFLSVVCHGRNSHICMQSKLRWRGWKRQLHLFSVLLFHCAVTEGTTLCSLKKGLCGFICLPGLTWPVGLAKKLMAEREKLDLTGVQAAKRAQIKMARQRGGRRKRYQ